MSVGVFFFQFPEIFVYHNADTTAFLFAVIIKCLIGHCIIRPLRPNREKLGHVWATFKLYTSLRSVCSHNKMLDRTQHTTIAAKPRKVCACIGNIQA